MEKTNILVVDDDEITRSFLSDILVHDGYAVTVTRNGQEALDSLQEEVPDLIISDVLMPGMNGLDLFKKVQEQEELHSLPFIFLTSIDEGDQFLSLKELGPDDYIPKPVRPKHLLATVRGKLRRKRLREDKIEKDQSQLRQRIRWTLSHELRTPLTIIQGISELLLNEGQSQPGNESQDLLQSLRTQSYELGSLIEDFLLVSRIDGGVEEENWQKGAVATELGAIVDEAAFPFWDRARSQKAEFEVEPPPGPSTVFVYRTHLLEILRQVMENAFKFADREKPRIQVRSEAGEGTAKVIVSNNGPGVSPEQREILFQKLTQVDREVNEQQGSGLGLYITKMLAEINRGSIALRSELGQGVEIEISMPTAPPK